jgi:RNA polymerase sigma-70 factor (ECF subfamily)
MEKVAFGDHGAFAELVRRHERWARTFAGRAIGDFQEAEDLAQEAFLRAWRSAPTWEARGSFRGWLTVTLSRLCIDHQRRSRPEPMDPLPERGAAAPGPLERLVGEEEERLLAEFIRDLPSAQRLAILLVYGEGRKTREAAEAMGMKLKAFESLLGRAREALRARRRGMERR